MKRHNSDVDVEAIILTGGASRRMGEDKAKLLIHGVEQARRIADDLIQVGVPVCALGREPIAHCGFLADEEQFSGPLAAISRFRPSREFVFVSSCDLPLFDYRIVQLLRDRIGEAPAAAPVVNDWAQPLCALYRSSAFPLAAEMAAKGYRCPSKWLQRLSPVLLSEDELIDHHINPQSAQGVNTREELDKVLGIVQE